MYKANGSERVASLPIVGVMGSGNDAHEALAEPLGRWLAALDVHLLTGGGGGVMTTVSRAFCDVHPRCGLCIGVLPGGDESAAMSGYPNPWVEIPIYTHLPLRGDRGMDALSRNHINVLSSTVLVALPGAAGTLSEIKLALRYGKPIIVFVASRAQYVDLPEEVCMTTEFADVQAFVKQHVQTSTM